MIQLFFNHDLEIFDLNEERSLEKRKHRFITTPEDLLNNKI